MRFQRRGVFGHRRIRAQCVECWAPRNRQWQALVLQTTRYTPPRLPTTALVCAIFDGQKHAEQKRRIVNGILRLEREYGASRLEAACRRALFLQAESLQSVTSILKYHLDEAHLPCASAELPVTQHGNLRGAAYFADSEDHEFNPTLN